MEKDLRQEIVDKLKVLADLEEQLFGDDRKFYSNRSLYQNAIQLQETIRCRQRLQELRNDTDLSIYTGKEYIDIYSNFLKLVIDSSHEDLQGVKSLFADGIDFREMEIDRYTEGNYPLYRKKLYLRTTQEEEIKDIVMSGPDILKQIKVSWTPMGIWEAYLLYAAKDWIYLFYLANDSANDIVGQDTYPYPSIRIKDDNALIHYVCHKQQDDTYVNRYVVASQEGESVRFWVHDEPIRNKTSEEDDLPF